MPAQPTFCVSAFPKDFGDGSSPGTMDPHSPSILPGALTKIHFKLFAMVDQSGGRHEADLRAMHPTAEELLMAAAWTQTQDPSDGFRAVLVLALRVLGVEVANPDQ
jgi:hypothetical protein